jgi:hypothetical protein
VAKRNRNSAAKAAAPAASTDEDNPLDEALAKLRATISTGEVFDAELQTSALIALLYMTDGAARETGLLTDVFVGFASEEPHGPEGAAYLRLLMSLGPRTVKRKAIHLSGSPALGGRHPVRHGVCTTSRATARSSR